MSSVAPNCRAACAPAPVDIPPWVSVGPSSTTSTRFPSIRPLSVAVITESTHTMVARGFALRDVRLHPLHALAGGALLTLLMTTTSALRRFTSPGW